MLHATAHAQTGELWSRNDKKGPYSWPTQHPIFLKLISQVLRGIAVYKFHKWYRMTTAC